MTPLPPGALKHLLETLPPERPDPFPHLADLSTDELLLRRVEISGHLKTLEQERQVVDAELLGSSQTLNSALVFVPLVVGCCAHAPAPVGITTLTSVMPSKVFRSRYSGMDTHNRW